MGSAPNKNSKIAGEILWKKLRQGRKEALSEIFNRYFDALYDYGFRIIADDHKVRDAIQEVFYQLWKYRENLTEVESIQAYLFVSLRREMLNEKSSRLRRKKMNREYSLKAFEVFVDYELWLDVLEMEQDQKDDLKQAVGKLTPRQREAVYLKYYEGLSTPELSDVMGIRAQSIYNTLSKAVRSLQDFLDS